MRAVVLLIAFLAACGHVAVPLRSEKLWVGDTAVRLRYGSEDAEVAREIRAGLDRSAALAERWGKLSAPVVITIHATHEALESASGQRGRPWLRAWAGDRSIDLQSPRTWSAPPDEASVLQLLTHELTHCVMFQTIDHSSSRRLGIPGWFTEGMAGVAAGEPIDATLETVARHYRDVLARGDSGGGDSLLAGAAVERVDPDLAYDAANAAFRFLLDTHGDEAVRKVMTGLGTGHRFPDAFLHGIGVDVKAFERAFRTHVLQATRS